MNFSPHPTSTRRWPLIAAAVLLLLLLASHRPAVFGQNCTADQEPNDEPTAAQPLNGCISGTLVTGDQDFFRFELSGPVSPFQMTLDGVPRTLTRAELFAVGADGRPRSLYALESPRGDAVVSPELFLGRGSYLIAIVPAGGIGPYEFAFQPGAPLPVASESEPNDQRETATTLAGAAAVRGELGGSIDWFRWSLSDSDAGRTWQLTAQGAVAQNLNLILFGADGSRLGNTRTDDIGRAALYDLRLPAGDYFISLDGDRNTVATYALTAISSEPLPPNREAEPNDGDEQAVPWNGVTPMRGRLAAVNDDDLFAFNVAEEASGQRFEIRLTAEGRADRTICLLHQPTALRYCRTGRGEIVLPDLTLAPGDYRLNIDGDAALEAFYELTRSNSGTAAPDQEHEPNDSYLFASSMGENQRAFGRLVGDEWDVFRLEVSGSAQLWRIQALGDGLTRVAILNTAGQIVEQINSNQPQRRIRISNLFLLPGTHYIGLRGADSDYQLLAIPLGPPPVGLELEPNSNDGQANELRFDEPRIGLLNELPERDFYRFNLPAAEVIRLTVIPPEDGNIQVRVLGENQHRLAHYAAERQPGQPLIWENLLPPGDYWVELRSDLLSDSAYRIQLERLDPFLPLADREPNGSRELASDFPPSFVAHGSVTRHDDRDWYRVPTVPRPTEMTLTIGGGHSLTIYDQEGTNLTSQFSWDGDDGVLSGPLQPDTPYFVSVREDAPYTLRLELDGIEPPQHEPSPLNGSVTLELDNSFVASFWPTGQRLTGRIIMSGEAAAAAELNWHTSHPRLQPPQILETVTTANGREVRFAVDVMADLPTGSHPLTIQLADGRGGSLTAQTIIESDPAAPPLAVQHTWSLPPQLLGGLNGAALVLGAEITTTDSALAERQPFLHDGYTPLNDGVLLPLAAGPPTFTVALAGSDPLPVHGILLNPQGRGAAHEKVREFELALSLDGQNFETVLTGVMQPSDLEQPFLLPQPVQARFARLRLLTNHNGGMGSVALGEWKVVIDPAFTWLGEINLVDPAAGGQLVYAEPQPSSTNDGVTYLLTDGSSPRLDLRGNPTALWVFGFHHGRAAQISRLEWVENPATDGAERLTSVRVEVSQESPVGPWREVAAVELAVGTTAITLPAATWARYVRLTATGPSAERFRPLGPDVIRIFERPAAAEYRSILGEWGHYSRSAIFEALTPPAVARAAAVDANDSRAQAQSITAGEPIDGQAAIGQDVDWYRVDVPADHNAIVLDLTGTPTVDVQALFEDEAGQLLPAAIKNPDSGRRVVTVNALPGSTVYFRIAEPPRSIIFSWDTSGSVSPYVDTIYNALTRFVEGVTPGQETANFLPFGRDLLLDTWGEQPAALQQALNNYPRSASSSNAEEALLKATDTLAFQEGTRAIVLITDAASPGYGDTAELWRAFEAVRPRLFTLSINPFLAAGELPADEQDLMQNWAAVNAGHYDFLRTQGEMAVAFERASAWLRRPAGYRFVAQTTFIEPPGPGTLQLLSSSTGENAAASASLLGNTAVEIIVDASGSMRQPLDGRTRIDVAREVLEELVSDVLPDDVPVALRVFGNREGNLSCRTDLEIPLQPLNRAELGAAIAAIEPQPDANTALGASLALVPDDLAAATGPKLVILLTDGEETCGAEPEQVITALRAAGIDVRVNIVGFAIDDAALKETFARWAAAGGGEYFDAAEPDDLTASLTQALRTPYRVLDSSGAIVGEGLVDGDPIQLSAGVYTIEILTDPQTILTDIVVPGEEAVVVRVRGE